MNVTVNNEQRLFVIPCGDGFSCYGFDNCYYESLQISLKLKCPDLAPKEQEKGQIAQYENYLKLLNEARKHPMRDTWFSFHTPLEVRDQLESVRVSRKNVRIFYGDSVTGKSWMDENDVYGKIGRSNGTFKIPLLIPPRQDGGCAVLTDCIVKIVEFSTKKGVVTPKVLYQHKSFQVPTLTIVENEHPDYPVSVLANNSVHARFKTMAKATKWISFMNGLSPTA